MRLLVHWILSALALLIVAHIVPGFYVSGLGGALIAALVIGLINATLGLFLKVITFPLAVLTLGIFWLVINALMLMVASALMKSFQVRGFWAAFLGAIVLALVNMLLRWLVPTRER
ncbi:MAG TPA: phage holin family protein [Terriglobales bacterium]|nr:phage holin family protein [Terriglobales bacterium]